MIDSKTYWAIRGRTFEAEAVRAGWWGVDNEPLVGLLATLRFRSVLDVGCGFGRMAGVARRLMRDVRYTGVDVSPDMLTSARRRFPDHEWVCADLREYQPVRRYDLVLAVSSLSYLTPGEIEPTLARLRAAAVRDLVVLDWNQTGRRTDCQYAHDWPALLGPDVAVTPLGRTSLYHLAMERP